MSLAPETEETVESGDTSRCRVLRFDLHRDGTCAIELLNDGDKRFLVFRKTSPLPALADEPTRPLRPDKEVPPAPQKIFREQLISTTVVDDTRNAVLMTRSLTLEQKGGRRVRIHFELAPSDPRVTVTTCKSKVEKIVVSSGKKNALDGRVLEKGKVYAPPSRVVVESREVAAPSRSVYEALRGSAPIVDDERTHGADAIAIDGVTQLPAETHARAAVTQRRPKSPVDKRAELLSRVAREQKRVRQILKNLDDDNERHGDPTQIAADGEWLKSVLPTLRRGDTSVVVNDDSGTSRTVILDATKSPTENLESYFHRARRARRGRAHIEPRRVELAHALTSLDAIRARLHDPSDEAIEDDVEDALRRRQSGGGHRARVRPSGGPRRPYRAFKTPDGVIIKVGRSAKDNDALTFHESRGNDVWLHVKNAAGSHVTIACPIDRLPTDVLVDAAKLAVWFSPLRGGQRGDVTYTERKHVRKPGKNVPSGLVTIHKERVIHVVIDDDDVRRLLASEVDANNPSSS